MSKLNYAGEYEIEVCKICSTSGEIIDITSLVSSINIFEDIFKSSLSGDIAIVDTNNLVTALPIIGQEKLLLKLTTPQTNAVNRNNSLDFTDHPLYIYKVDSKLEVNDSTSALVLSFTTAEAVRSNRIRVSQAFEGEPSADMIQKIIRDEDLLNSICVHLTSSILLQKDVYLTNITSHLHSYSMRHVRDSILEPLIVCWTERMSKQSILTKRQV